MIRRAATAALIAVGMALAPTGPAAAVTSKAVNSNWSCSIPVKRWPDHKVKLTTTWTVKYTKPVTIRPEFWRVWTNNWQGGLVKMTSYDARLLLDGKGGEQKIHVASGADDIEYGWGAPMRQGWYKALDYPVWKVRITTAQGSCTVTNRHVSW